MFNWMALFQDIGWQERDRKQSITQWKGRASYVELKRTLLTSCTSHDIPHCGRWEGRSEPKKQLQDFSRLYLLKAAQRTDIDSSREVHSWCQAKQFKIKLKII